MDNDTSKQDSIEYLDDTLETFIRDSPTGDYLTGENDESSDTLLDPRFIFRPSEPMQIPPRGEEGTDVVINPSTFNSFEPGSSSVPVVLIDSSYQSDFSVSPNKKVKFELGGDDEDSLSLRFEGMSQANNPNELTSTNTPVRNRVDSRDYIAQPSSAIALLPAIAEEKSGNTVTTPFYGRSTSTNDTSSRIFNPEGEREVYGFVQLDVLSGDGDLSQKEWKETARWIKYEEDLEEGADRWGRPHIATLSFYSLIKLRQLIERDGIFMFDLDEKDMPGIAYRIVEELSSKGLIKTDDCPLLMRTLLLKHKHVEEVESSWLNRLRRTNTSTSTQSSLNLQSMLDDKHRNRSMLDPSHLIRRNSINKVISEMTSSSKSLQRTGSGNYLRQNMGEHITVDVKPINVQDYCPSEEDLKWILGKENMLRRLPFGAEATLVFVGEFEAIKKPIFVFVRLAESSFMFNVSEVPLPSRFFGFLLVPTNAEVEIVEVGRAFGTLMSNRHFYDIASTSKTRKNLLSGINEFLDDSLVLPPGDWDNQDLLPLHVLQSKSKAIRKRRIKKQMSFLLPNNDSFIDANASIQSPLPEINDKKEVGSDPFARTKIPFGGMFNEMKTRYPKYKSDIWDGLNFQCLATVIFMYCASIAQIITFAGLIGDKTQEHIGMSETLMATSASGVFFSLVSGQPLIPIGPTGPLLVFDEILFLFCSRHGIEFLPARVWISIWLFILITIFVCFEGSVLVKWCTRFTQDIFAVLTSALLMYESVDNLIEIYVHHPLGSEPLDTRPISLQINTTHYSLVYEETTEAPIVDESEDLRRQPNTALLCTILMLGTFFIAYFLREFRNSVFLGERARRALGDFGVPIAVITMVFLDYSATDTYTQKMKVPEGLQPSNTDIRGWLISPFGVNGDFPYKIAFGCILPAMLVFILMFMTAQVCELIVNKKERKLVKGSGFHLDIFLIALINLGCGFFGAPWVCAATLRALAHVTALTVYSQNNIPGEKPTIVQVKEQRITNLSLSLLIGSTVLLAPVLQYIPLAVLFGVFLYMGVASLSSTQLFDRFSLLFIPAKQHPQTIYVRRVRTWKMHLYTGIQLACLGMLWGVKSWKDAALAFPFVLMLLVPIRFQLKYLFNESELEALDGDPSPAK